MVKGLKVFREHFRDYADRYVLIGDAACDIAITAAGLAFRATKDLLAAFVLAQSWQAHGVAELSLEDNCSKSCRIRLPCRISLNEMGEF